MTHVELWAALEGRTIVNVGSDGTTHRVRCVRLFLDDGTCIEIAAKSVKGLDLAVSSRKVPE